MTTFVVVLAGGAGTRFWPAGRRALPKQLLPITGERSMLAETLARCAPLAPPEHTFVVTNRIQVEETRRACPELSEAQILAEPSMRNTAAAIGVAAVCAAQRDPEGVMVVLPADHYIHPVESFLRCFSAAAQRAAGADVLMTIGIQPTGPATGYGYIESGRQVTTVDGLPVHAVESFKEKPDSATAARFLATGRYLWNAGTFVWRIPTLLDAFKKHLPRHFAILKDIEAKLRCGGGLDAEEYDRFESVPVDKGIMEKAPNVEVIPASFTWDDVGSWLAVDRLGTHDEQGNVVRGNHVGIDTRNCLVFSDGDHVVATLGVEDLIIVHAGNATLVCPKSRAEEVRALVDRLREEGQEAYL